MIPAHLSFIREVRQSQGFRDSRFQRPDSLDNTALVTRGGAQPFFLCFGQGCYDDAGKSESDLL
jgi:hypothetical protein